MKVSYFKTQWWRLLIALVCLVMCCVYVFKPSPVIEYSNQCQIQLMHSYLVFQKL